MKKSKVVTFLEQNKEYGFKPKQISESTGVAVSTVYKVKSLNQDKIKGYTTGKGVYYLLEV